MPLKNKNTDYLSSASWLYLLSSSYLVSYLVLPSLIFSCCYFLSACSLERFHYHSAHNNNAYEKAKISSEENIENENSVSLIPTDIQQGKVKNTKVQVGDTGKRSHSSYDKEFEEQTQAVIVKSRKVSELANGRQLKCQQELAIPASQLTGAKLIESAFGVLLVGEYANQHGLWLIRQASGVTTNRHQISYCLLLDAEILRSQTLNIASLHANGRWLALGYAGGRLSLYDIAEQREVNKLSNSRARFTAMTFDESTDALMFGRSDGYIYRWEFHQEQEYRVRGLQPLQRYSGAGSIISSLVVHSSGRFFLSADWSGALQVWLPFDQKAFSSEYVVNPFMQRGLFSASATRLGGARAAGSIIEFLGFVGNNQHFFAARRDGWIELWRVRGFRKLSETRLIGGEFRKVSVDKRGTHLAGIGREGILNFFRVTLEPEDAQDLETGLPLVSRIELSLNTVKHSGVDKTYSDLAFLAGGLLVLLEETGKIEFLETNF